MYNYDIFQISRLSQEVHSPSEFFSIGLARNFTLDRFAIDEPSPLSFSFLPLPWTPAGLICTSKDIQDREKRSGPRDEQRDYRRSARLPLERLDNAIISAVVPRRCRFSADSSPFSATHERNVRK